MNKKALITGITGQDGSYLAELLLEKKYEVHGIVRRSSASNLERIRHLCNKEITSRRAITLHCGDLTDPASLASIIARIRPQEVYNLGAQSDVALSFQIPKYTMDATGSSVVSILEAIRSERSSARFYQASSSEIFGKTSEVPQRETTPFHPRSPYGVAKVQGYWATVNYRESYGIHASNGILFNHESPRRGENFVSRKITKSIAEIIIGRRNMFYLGNLDARRDWGYAKDYVEGMWRILQENLPGDYILATNQTHTVREFVEEAFRCVGIDIVWRGTGANEKGIAKATGKVVVAVNRKLLRPAEVDILRGDYTKARRILGWKPRVAFKELVRLMMEHDLRAARELI